MSTFQSQKLLSSAVLVFVLLASQLQITAAEPFWPRFHGPDGNNRSSDTGLLTQWPAEGPELIWTTTGVGEGFSSVSLSDGMIYTAGNIDDQSVVTAMDMDGKVAWQTPCGPPWTKSYPGTRGTPTIDGDRLYFETPVGDVVCLQAKTGKKIWNRNIIEDFVAKNIKWALAESVVIVDNLLICSPFGEKGSVVALDKMTGETVWAAESVDDDAGYATPTISEFQGRRIVLAMNGKALVGVDLAAGKLLFRHEHLTKYDVNALKPVCIDDEVFISSGYGAGSELIRLLPGDGGVQAKQVWASKDMDNHHGGVVVDNGLIFGSNGKGKWVCLDWKTGDTKYSTDGVGKGSLTYADGLLYTLSENGGTMGLVKPSADGHEIISQFSIPAGGEGKSWAHPVVTGGRLYVRHGDFVYAFNVSR